VTTEFEQHRSFLVGLAYRMLGSVSDAEDIVQDAFLRWREADHGAVEHPRAYLARVVSRLCLDRMKSATARREHYVGTWLPERLGNASGRLGARVALFAGLIAAVNGGLVLAVATGGPGSGNGVVGGAAALVLALVGMALGGLALARSRPTV
jgi:hypothetical protein